MASTMPLQRPCSRQGDSLALRGSRGAVARGLVAGTTGTPAMDALLHAEYKRGGGTSETVVRGALPASCRTAGRPWSTTSCTGDTGSRTVPHTASSPDQRPGRRAGTARCSAPASGVPATSYSRQQSSTSLRSSVIRPDVDDFEVELEPDLPAQ